MHRFYLSPERCGGDSLTLDDNEAHHAAQVLRVSVGERVTILDGAGHEFLCEVRAVSRKNVVASVQQKNFTPPLPCQLTLLQAVPKGKIIETIIQKATELGAARIVPLLSERVTTQLDADTAADKSQKWQNVAIEAIKQCGQPWLPRIDQPVTPKDFLSKGEKFDLPLIASLQSDSRHPREYFQSYFSDQKRLPRTVGIWVGPEGDFTPAELSAAKSAGALPISLGRLVLRCETAAIYCLSILNYELQSALR